MLGWKEDRINVPPALLPVIPASHICKKSELFLRGAGTGLCFLVASFIQSIISSTCRHTPTPPIKPISYPCPTSHTLPMHPWDYTKHNQQTPCHFLSVHPEDLDHPTGHFCSPEDEGGTGHFFPTSAILEHLLSPPKDSNYKSFHSLPLCVPVIYFCIANITPISIPEAHFQFLGDFRPCPDVPSPRPLLLVIQ